MLVPKRVSIVLPVLNEAQNLPLLLEQLYRLASNKLAVWITEIIIVDDGSTDGTAGLLDRLATGDRPIPIRIIRRHVRKGSANAELVGCQAAIGEIVVKMDADGQHPVSVIADLVRAFDQDTDLVLASRYAPGGSTRYPAFRGLVSRGAKAIARLLVPQARGIRDPISGFFAVRRRKLVQLIPENTRYKLALYILAANPEMRWKEVPFHMAARRNGKSKIVGASLKYIVVFLAEVIAYGRLAASGRDRLALDSFPGASRNPGTAR